MSKLLNINCISAVNVNNSKNMCDLTYFKNGHVNTFSYGYISKMTSGECHNCVKNHKTMNRHFVNSTDVFIFQVFSTATMNQ